MKLTSLWTGVNNRVFDYISTTAPPRPESPGVIFVAIDEPSFSELGLPWPWPRLIHANLTTALKEAGAKAIAFDVVFAESDNYEHDLALGKAAGNITVFAADETLIDTPNASQLIRTEPNPDILSGGAKAGVASISLDGDGSVRALPNYPDGFMRQLFEIAEPNMPAPVMEDRLIQYFGPAGTYPRVSYYQAMDPARYLPPNYFKDKVVIIGYGLQAVPDIENNGVDAFETPYTARTGQLTYGAEIHATIFDNFKHDLSIKRPPKWIGFALLIFGGLAGLAASRLPKWSLRSAAGILGILGLGIAGWAALTYGRIWLSPFDPAIGLAGVMGALALRDFSLEQKLRREIHSAFSQYLSPDMVNKIAADPAQLNLGGEQKTLTIMFADIRGFTALSEHFKDDPQGLTQLVNDILSPLSDIIMGHGGTIDKYIGDCIMAFWNAPLDDPDHAANAVAAAQEMITSLDQINTNLAAQIESLQNVNIRIGIGINTGRCVVGNMGSKSRFDYSVLGDAVNVAARLEGLSKTYDTPIIVGQNTQEQLGADADLKPLDTLKVKGRAEAVTIYTP